MCRLENSAQLIGTVAGTPSIITTVGGVKQASFSLVTVERYKNSSDEVVTDTQFHSVIARGRLATRIEERVAKGDLIAIEGKLCSRNYINKMGIKVYRTDVQLRELLVVRASRKEQSLTEQEALLYHKSLGAFA